jgi:hypothetical protein
MLSEHCANAPRDAAPDESLQDDGVFLLRNASFEHHRLGDV